MGTACGNGEAKALCTSLKACFSPLFQKLYAWALELKIAWGLCLALRAPVFSAPDLWYILGTDGETFQERGQMRKNCSLVGELQFEIFTVEFNAVHTSACSREQAERMGNAWLVPDCLFARRIIVSAGAGESSQKNATCSSSFADASSPLSPQPHFTRHDWYPYNVLWLKVAKSLLLWCGSQRDPSFCKCIKGALTVVQKEIPFWKGGGGRDTELLSHGNCCACQCWHMDHWSASEHA